MKIYFVIWKIYMRSLAYVKIKYMHFCLYQWKRGTGFMFQKNDFENFKKFESIFLI